MITGAHLRNEVEPTAEDRRLFKIGRFSGALAMWYQDPDDVVATIGEWEVQNSVVRLPDSLYVDWSTGNRYFPHFSTYAEDCLTVIERYRAKGFHLFQLDNEPDLTWLPHGYSHWDYATFLKDVLRYMEPELPTGTGLLSPPLSVEAIDQNWAVAYETLDIVRYFVGTAVHCYWQAAGDMYADWAGGRFKWWLDRWQMPAFITEAGNSKIQSPNPLPLPEIQALQAEQYPRYVRWARCEGADAVYFYILGHNGDWTGFDLVEPICRALGRRYRVMRVGNQIRAI